MSPSDLLVNHVSRRLQDSNESSRVQKGNCRVELGLPRYLWGFCENETSRETNLARRDFSRD